MEFPTSLTLNAGKTLPVCEYDANGSGWQTASNCGIDNVDNTLELQLAGHNMDTGVEHKVRFRGYDYNVYAANVADVFEFCLSSKTNILSADYLDTVCAEGNVPPAALTTGTLAPDCIGNDIYSVYTLTIKPVANHNAVGTVNPEIRVKLPTRDSTNAQNGFPLDGGITNGNFPCQSAIQGTSITCSVTNATSYATDQFVELRITGHSIITNTADTVVYFVLKNPLKENLTYNASIELGYLINRVFRITEQTATVAITTHTAAVTSSSHPWTTNLCGKRDIDTPANNPSTPRQYYAINSTTDLTCRVKSAASTSGTAGDSMSWQFPVGWDLSTINE